MTGLNVTEKDVFLENMNKMYEEREAIFEKREQEYEKQKKILSVMLKQIQKEMKKLDQQAEEQAVIQNKLDEKQMMVQDWYNEVVQMRKGLEEREKQLEEGKEEILVQSRMKLEEAKNEKIKVQQVKEELEHQLSLVRILLDKQGEDGVKASTFFMKWVEQSSSKEANVSVQDEEELLKQLSMLKKELASSSEQIVSLRDEKEILEAENAKLADANAHFELERKNLLGLIAKMRSSGQVKNIQKVEVQTEEKEEEIVHKKVPEAVAEQSNAHENVYEELTATTLQTYLQKSKEPYDHLEIRHSEDCEQLHVTMNGLQYAFLFSTPAAFEVSASRKNGRVLQKVIAKMNEKHPDVKFYYEDGRVYATGYFTNTINPALLMERVKCISDCFKQ